MGNEIEEHVAQMILSIKKFFNKIWSWIKQDVEPEHKDFKYTLMWCGGLAISTFLSLFWEFPIWITLALSAGAILTSKGGRIIYAFIFLIPLSYTLKTDPSNYSFRPYIMLFIVAVLGIKYIIRILRKQEKIELLPLVFCVLLIFLFCLPFTFTDIQRTASVITSIVLVFLMWHFRKDINIREIFILFFIGVTLSACFGLIANAGGVRLSSFVYPDPNRFSGLYDSPCRLALESMICLLILCVLHYNGDMKHLFYPMLAVLMLCMLSTAAKTSIVVVVVLLALFLGFHIVKSVKNKYPAKKIIFFVAAVGCICLACVLICSNIVSKLSDRFFFINEDSIGQIIQEEILIDQGYALTEQNKITMFLNSITTYRYNIWVSYFKVIFSDFWHAMFGFGVGAPFIGSNGYNVFTGYSPHCTYVEALYYVGFFGIIVMIGWALLLLIPLIKQKKVNWVNIIMVAIVFGLLLIPDEIVLTMLGIYLVMLCPLITYRGRSTEKKQELLDSDAAKSNSIIENRID